MTNHLISVSPVEGGWQVDSAVTGHPLMFFSGAEAERKARSLAQLLADTGSDARVFVHDRRNTLIGTVNYYAFGA